MTSPPVDRIVSVLNLLASRPDDEFALSDIVTELGMARATAHAIVTSLAHHGYLVRSARPGYMLGPALIPLGTGAREQLAPLAAVRVEMERLAERYLLDVVATMIVDQEMLAVEHVRPPNGFGYAVPSGYRSRLMPPIGITHLAWASSEDMSRWLAGQAGAWTRAQMEDFQQVLAEVRETGFLAGFAHWHRAPDVDYERVGVPPRGEPSPRFNHMSAPVFGPDGRVALGLMLLGTADQMQEIGIEPLSTELVAATRRAGAAAYGRASGPRGAH